MISRRKFINAMGTGGLMLGVDLFPYRLFDKGEVTKITILHTNDVHSRIDPFPMDGGRNEGMAGLAARYRMIENIRAEEDNVLLFDSGDIFQGTPYFNFFGGEVEIKGMSKLGYDVATIGNHDFDGGIDGFVKQMPHADFDFVISNYDVSDTAMAPFLKEYVIKEVGGIRIGVFGLGIELEGLVPDKLCKGVVYHDPVSYGQRIATHLKEELRCDAVICLSHLGFKYEEDIVSDVVLAKETDNIDLILGGHTHTFLDAMVTTTNKSDQAVFINQAGFGGLMLGRIDLYFENNKKTKCQTCKNLFVE